MDTNEFDLIVLLEKREYPKCIENKALPARDDEYVCLGHFDYARIDDITKKTLKELIKYLKSVKIGVVRENEASKMVSKILEDKAPVVLPEYMI